MENLSPMHLLLLVVILIVVFGSKRIPELGSSLGQGIRAFKRSMNEDGTPSTLPPARPDATAAIPPAGTEDGRPKKLSE